MIPALLSLLLLSACFGENSFPVKTLKACGISQATIDGVQNVINEHSSIIQLAQSNNRAKKTEIDSLKADVDFYLEENAPNEDKKKWTNCVTKKKSIS